MQACQRSTCVHACSLNREPVFDKKHCHLPGLHDIHTHDLVPVELLSMRCHPACSGPPFQTDLKGLRQACACAQPTRLRTRQHLAQSFCLGALCCRTWWRSRASTVAFTTSHDVRSAGTPKQLALTLHLCAFLVQNGGVRCYYSLYERFRK